MLTSDADAPAHILGGRVAAAVEAGCGGMIVAAADVARGQATAPRLLAVVPGIRLPGGDTHDQARFAAPSRRLPGRRRHARHRPGRHRGQGPRRRCRRPPLRHHRQRRPDRLALPPPARLADNRSSPLGGWTITTGMKAFRRTSAATRWVLGSLAVAVLATGCGMSRGVPQADGSPASGPKVVLRAAVERTLDSRTLRIVRTRAGVSEPAGGTMISEYQAPDRGRSVRTGDRPAEILVVGNALYLSAPDRDGFFSGRAPSETTNLASANLLLPLEVLRDAKNVTEAGGIFRAEGVRGTAEAEIEEGYVTRVRLRWERDANRFDADYELSRFDAELRPIEAPTADRLLPADGAQPACDPEREQPSVLCSTTAAAPSPAVDLPAPSGPTESTLQVRPVIKVTPLLAGDGAGCSQDGTNPLPAATVRVPGRADCYELGAAEAEIVRAASIVATSRPGDDVELSSYFTEDVKVDLRVSFTPEDAPRITAAATATATARPLGSVVVMFGRVLTAAELDADSGAFVFAGMTTQLASRIEAALTGAAVET